MKRLACRSLRKVPPLLAALGFATSAGAEPVELPHADGVVQTSVAPNAAEPAPDRFVVVGRSETYLQLFRRALLPGPGGAAVTSEVGSPLVQYLQVSARDVDAPWQADAVELELSAWGRVWPTSSGFERPFDGDLQTANVALTAGPLSLRAGRQTLAGGAARFVRFDGLSLSASLPAGLFLAAYGGWTVLPRWDARPGYQQLGLKERELSSGEELSLSRAAHWLTGARFGYDSQRLRAVASMHEQRETGGLAHRNLGLDATAALGSSVDVGSALLYELDQRHFAELRGWLGLRPLPSVDATLEALRTKPALFLSRQSVLSVFGSSAYDEAGGFLSWRAFEFLRFDGAGYFESYDTGRAGARADAAARFELGGALHTLVRLGYGRVIIGDQGYQALRASLGRQLARNLAGTLDLYGYFYDRAVLGYRSSSVYSGSLSYRVSAPLELLWGASLFRSPYASLDAQTLLRLSYELDATSGRRP